MILLICLGRHVDTALQLDLNIEVTCSTCRILRRDLLLRRLRRPLLLHFKKKPTTLSEVPRREGRKKRLISTTLWMGSRAQ